MRPFFAVIGVLAWLWALSLLVIFSQSGGEMKFVAAGVYAIVGILAMGCERILKVLEDIRNSLTSDGRTSNDVLALGTHRNLDVAKSRISVPAH